MSRTILLDANVVDQIHRGNAAAANALLGMVQSGDSVYISQQAYNELIVNAFPRAATANRMLLERLNIQIAPSGAMASRVDVYGRNEAQVVSLPDSLVAAQAKAINAELWSFDRAFRLNAAVTNRLGVRVAPECSSISLVAGAQADYRVGFQLIGLPPVEITTAGAIKRRGPSGAAPSALGATIGGTTRGAPSAPSGSSGGPAPSAGRTTAIVGVADNTLPFVGGPSPGGTAVIGGIQLVFQGANFILNRINDQVQARRAREALAQIDGAVNRERTSNPSLGVLLVFFYRQIQAPPDSLIQPGPVFMQVEYALGQTQDEATQNWAATPALRRGPGPTEQIDTQRVWIPPLQAATVTRLRTPFPIAAFGTFASTTAGKLQDVEWGGVTGFDDEGETTVAIDAASPIEFAILRPPSEVRWFNGTIRMTTDIPLVTRVTPHGHDVMVVDLDPWAPGSVSAAMVFPANAAADTLFSAAPATKDNLSQLRGYVNFGRVRWVKPGNLRVLRRA